MESAHLDKPSSLPALAEALTIGDSSSPSSILSPASSAISTPTPSDDQDLSLAFSTPSGAPFKSRYGPSANPKKVAPFTFGQRLLSSEDNLWDYNAWDHATPDSEYLSHIATQIQTQKSNPVTPFDKKRFHAHPDKFWNKFYANNNVNFFKDRKWLGQEFPLLREACASEARPYRVLEVGAGAGNTLFPVLKQNQSEGFHITAADFSAVSVSLIQSQPAFVANHPKHVDAKVWDLADPDLAHLPCTPNSLDIIILIFVFSALAPWQWKTAVRNVERMLKPGGSVLFRDYGRGDLAQVRMKGGRWLGENFYVRGDGTRVYFFEEGEIRDIFEERKAAEEGMNVGPWGGKVDGNGCGKVAREEDSSSSSSSGGSRSGNAEVRPQENEELTSTSTPTESTPPPAESEETATRLLVSKIGTDRRMLVNRKRQLKMYRCWLQMQCAKEP
ncbi:S-adenosyl-L-methionine-dependent methyltransferase [Tirmania nivea]|nr:S-adenosyl-L-methionine-dependent methyltransferase [Tirmania nivea]